MRHGSLFSGIGGFDLAAEWMGWGNIFHCEWNPFGQKVLKHHFPNSISYNDITKTDFSIHRGNIDIITGGFPCQPYSTAGLRKGKEDERHLFPEMLRAIKEVQPRWVVGENVRGLVSWNEGLVFHEVYDDLEREGYEVKSFLIPAAGVGAPHQRYRVWFVAYSSSCRLEANNSVRKSKGEKHSTWMGSKEFFTNTDSWRLERSVKEGWDSEYVKWKNETIAQQNSTNSKSIGQEYALENRELEGRRFRQSSERNFWDSFPSKSPLCGGDDGIPRELDSITFPKWRNESIKAYGNAIVPQVAHQIFMTIESFENSL